MNQDRMDNQSHNEENEKRQPETFESDTQKIVRRHLENKDDVITDEDIASIRVGMTPPVMDAATKARFEDDETREQVEEEYLGDDKDLNDGEADAGKKITPWDTIDPK
ncbi:MAG TPA: hypothetical protein VFR58_03535 [Flavisolibacter sp.]|nr:hypothetical protein [Flavisolibacter sp.]